MIGESLEDFLEAVYSLGGDGWADTKRISDKLGVKISSVHVSAGKLINLGLVQGKDRIQQVKLTPIGLNVAKTINKKHDVIKRFLTDFLCVKPETAELDAHHLEHVISDESMDKIVGFLEFIEDSPEEYSKWFEKFRGTVCQVR